MNSRYKRLREIELQKIDVLDGATSSFLGRLGGTLNALNRKLDKLLREFDLSGDRVAVNQANLVRSMTIARDIEEVLLETGYKQNVADLLRSYDRIAALSSQGLTVAGIDAPFTRTDIKALVALKDLDFRRWETFGQELIDSTQKSIMDSVVMGSKFNDMQDNLAGILRGMGEKESYIKTRAKTLANTYGMAFDRAVTNMKAKQTDTETFVYIGPDDKLTRSFCHAVLSGEGSEEFNVPAKSGDTPIFTQDEIDEMDNGTDLPVNQFGGGYNCRHKFYPYDVRAEVLA